MSQEYNTIISAKMQDFCQNKKLSLDRGQKKCYNINNKSSRQTVTPEIQIIEITAIYWKQRRLFLFIVYVYYKLDYSTDE